MKNWNSPEVVELNVVETACTDSNKGWGSNNCWGNNGWGHNGGSNNNNNNNCGGNNNNWGDCDDDTDCMS